MLRFIRVHLALFLCSLSSTITGAAFAGQPQTDVNEHVVVTATATGVPFEQVTRSVDVITREQIDRLPARSIADVLRLVAGVDVRSRGERGVQTDFSLRGAAFGQTLVLVDGQRINDAQSGHHNGDIPVPLDQVERIEILQGAGSSLHGADAFGGTINVITRAGAMPPSARLGVGRFGSVDAAAAATLRTGAVQHAVAVEASHSDGFMFARDFDVATAGVRSTLGPHTRVFAGFARKAFGANGFYGASPSKEWTNQFLTGGDHELALPHGWRMTMAASYRTHGDRFLWDVRRPGVSENTHRTHAVTGTARATRAIRPDLRLSVGAEFGGDWMESSNLGDRSFGRESGFAEVQWHPTATVTIVPAARFDHYSRFGSAASPALSAGWWASPRIKVRGAVGRAFRVPTFTELYYTDPNHQASGELEPERTLATEAGIDWLPAAGWLARATVFDRRDRDVIDWVRPSTAVKWQTTNVMRVNTQGVELGAQRSIGGPSGALLGMQYVWLRSDPEGLDLLSKYLLEYSKHTLVGSGSVVLPLGVSWGQRLEYRARYDGQKYWLAETRLARRVRRVEVYVEATNLFNESYHEIAGVVAAPRWIRAGLSIR
jgi:outer membrane cobalamin receptor